MKDFFKYLSNTPTIYMLVWCMYYLQGTLYAEGSFLSRTFLALFLLMSLFYAFKLTSLRLNKYIKSIVALAVLFGLYGLLRIIVGNSGAWISPNEPTTFFKEYELSILPIFAFYYFTITRKLEEDWFYKSVFIFLVVALALYFREQTSRITEYMRDEVTNNTGYKFMALLPLTIFFKRKPLLQFAYLAFVLVFILQAMKRGAIIVAAISLVILLPDMYRAVSGRRKFFVTLLSVAILVGGFYYVTMVSMNSDYFLLRLSETIDGNASGREDMFPTYYKFYMDNPDGVAKIFGSGADATLKYIGEYAHNDWLEILINHGFVGFLVYLVYWFNASMYALKERKKIPSELTTIIVITIIAYFVKSFFSMSINDMPLFTTSALGYAIAKKDMILRNL